MVRVVEEWGQRLAVRHRHAGLLDLVEEGMCERVGRRDARLRVEAQQPIEEVERSCRCLGQQLEMTSQAVRPRSSNERRRNCVSLWDDSPSCTIQP